ncbi:MAG TPA: class I SAM-dependent methyltransferase [Acidimicrobiales bacterium]|nr:class I SAM-dependent methyltransferase [Acidimicrobiales bacterium]
MGRGTGRRREPPTTMIGGRRAAWWVGAAVLAALPALARRHRRPRSRPVFAWWYGHLARRAERGEIGRRRHQLLADATGRVLDLGAGTGESFKHLSPAVRELVALEPDPAMVRQAARRVGESEVPVRVVRGVSEGLPFAAATFDTVVACLVLCSVADLDATVTEVRRVLRAQGRLVLMEHVRAGDEGLAEWQDLVDRPWSWVNGGCHPNRRTLAALEGAGFCVESLQRSGFAVLPHVHGVAPRV